jgi:hypothetical protein
MGRWLRRIKARADQAIANANAAAVQAQGVVQHADQTLSATDALVAELMDGVSLVLVHEGQGTILDFLSGKVKTLPLKVKVVVDEQEVKDAS